MWKFIENCTIVNFQSNWYFNQTFHVISDCCCNNSQNLFSNFITLSFDNQCPAAQLCNDILTRIDRYLEGLLWCLSALWESCQSVGKFVEMTVWQRPKSWSPLRVWFGAVVALRNGGRNSTKCFLGPYYKIQQIGILLYTYRGSISLVYLVMPLISALQFLLEKQLFQCCVNKMQWQNRFK